ncbi:TonB C-terminal domain-containing protein [Massilia sp. YIM B04103]|uniref:TonB C-terminal domain-containing protein n=1 Tax=Massilia sp. YIM B04103 TaxID=2963106 RepID=UPI002109F8B8|nr:TonB C-terminal domain-containing protein [Massilia sp. YIM B04103]
MRDSFPFLIRLGLRPDADARDIRRAYARELKKIDQVADPAGFQELRQSYEVALSWHAYQQSTPEDGSDNVEAAAQGPVEMAAPMQELELEPIFPSQPTEALLPPEDPRELADQAFEEFIANIIEQEPHLKSHHAKSYATVLQSSLDSDGLLNLTARIFFEARIVGMFASGSNPGQEALFAAASEVFEWERDRRRIQQFGEAGAMVSQAVDELKLFQSLTPYVMGTYKQLIRTVHAKPNPEGAVNRSDLMLFHQVVSRFHTWFAVTIDRATLKNWIEASHAESQRLPGDPRPGEQGGQEPASKSIWELPIVQSLLAMMLLAIVTGFFNLLGETRRPKGFYPPADRNNTQEVAKDSYHPPSQEQIEDIRSRIHYKWPSDTAPGEYAVVYEVFIDADGVVLGMNRKQSSGNKGYDKAVEKAIRETSPFPKGTQTVFLLRYGVIFSKREAPKGSPPSDAQLAAVQEKISYVPSASVESGELRVDYDVEIDNKGTVIKLKKLKASRDSAFDDAVADALKEADVFTPENRRKFGVTFSRTWRR